MICDLGRAQRIDRVWMGGLEKGGSLVLTCLEVRELNENPVNFELIHSTQDHQQLCQRKYRSSCLQALSVLWGV